jgi:hypothetical protein
MKHPKKKAAKRAAKKTHPRAVRVAAKGTTEATIIKLMSREAGATLQELMAVGEGRLAHSVRGLVAGRIKKQLGLTVESTRDEKGNRRYRIARA